MISLHAFHFLRPLWLFALPILWGLVYWMKRRRENEAEWSGIIDAELWSALRLDDKGAKGMSRWPVLALFWTLAALALAGPSWEKDQAAAFRTAMDWVFVLDLSSSMSDTDIQPSRIARARYALDDLLDSAHDARVGLVVFSDEPYTVVPLTQDVATVKALLPPLSPNIMPSSGDQLAPALELAGKLLKAGAAKSQRIVVLSDGFDDDKAAISTSLSLKSRGITVSVIGTGDSKDQFRQLASAGGGEYVGLSALGSLIHYLQEAPLASRDAAPGIEVSHWQDEGIWLLPFLLLLASMLARRGWL